MSDGSVDPSKHKQALSALVDGELDQGAVSRVCAAWREDADVRRDWHAYQLIGDVLRSEDLAAKPERDESFLLALRARLAEEPVVLAPQPLPAAEPLPQGAKVATAGGRRMWAAPIAVAAGFVAVAGVLAVTRVSAPGGAVPAGGMALAPQGAVAVQTVAATSSPAALSMIDADNALPPLDMKLIRDVQLDRYLAAHKQFGNSTAVSVPGVMLRNAATYVPER